MRLCKLWGIDKVRTTSYYPAGDGLCERYNKVLGDSLYSAVRQCDDRRNWDKYLDAIAFAYNSSPHKATDIEPARLVFTRQIKDPAFLSVLPDEASVTEVDPNDYLEKKANQTKVLFDIARQRIKKDYEARKKAYDKKSIPPNKFSVGQLVRRKIESRIGKFAERYEGPFEVTRVFEDNPNVVEIRKDDGTNDTVNVSKIHHWVLAPPELVCERAKTPEDSAKTVRVPRRIRSMKDTTQQVDEVQATPLSLDIPVGPSPEDPLIQLENFQQNPEPYQLQLDPRQSIMQDPRPKRLRQQSVFINCIFQ